MAWRLIVLITQALVRLPRFKSTRYRKNCDNLIFKETDKKMI